MMASVKQLGERKFRITVCNGYHADRRKICRSLTIHVPKNVQKRSVRQYVLHEAEEMEREFRCGFSEDAAMSFESYTEKWFARQTRYKPATLAGYRAMLRVCCEWIGGVRLRNIRPLVIEELANKLRQRKFREQVISEQTVHKYLNAVSVVLEDARHNEILRHNAVRLCRFPNPRVEATQVIPSASEMKRLLDCLLLEPMVYRIYYLMAIATGCRRGELCALRWGDFQDGYVRIARSRSPVTGQGIVETDTKNHRIRYILLLGGIRNLLEELFLNRCQTVYDETGWPVMEGNPPTPEDYIFIDRMTGKPIHPDTFSRRLRRIYDRNGFNSRFHLHTLRHFLASFLLDNGVSNKMTADILGHRDTGFLERTYGHVLPEYEREATKCIGRLFDSQAFHVDNYDTANDANV